LVDNELEDDSVQESTPINNAHRYKSGLSKSRGFLSQVLKRITGSGVDEDTLEELEETLLMADVGAKTSFSIVEKLRQYSNSDDNLQDVLKTELMNILQEDVPLVIGEERPYVMVMVGVNGSGKTTTIGKLAHRYVQEGLTVMVAAGDTYRAGAIEQLKVWADRVGAEFVSASPGADPGSVMYNALDSAKAKNIDVLLCDTAGRLQAQRALMDELKKVVRVIQKKQPDAPHECLLVLDSTIGQNALAQADGFIKAAPLTGVVLTKLDGTAKGGVVLAVKNETNIPVRLVGLGEQPDDLQDFNREMFINAIFDDVDGGIE
jgi:fused signal recognition particle receptor